MFFFVYNILLSVFTFIFFPFWAIGLKLRGRAVAPYFKGFSPVQTIRLQGKPVVWVQASSVGETMVAATFLQEFRREFPEWAVAFTCTTQTGKETAHRLLKEWADLIGFFPFDYPWVARRFICRLNPSLLVLIETELWPNILQQARKNGTKVMIVNGRLGDRSFHRLQRTGFYRPVLKLVDLYCAQSQLDKERFIALGALAERIQVTGNIKFDQGIKEPNEAKLKEFTKPLQLEQGTPVLTAGSTHNGEDEVILTAFDKIKKELPQAFLIIAPRHLERVESIERLLEKYSFRWIKRSAILDGKAATEQQDLLLLDTYGELNVAYALSTVAFVGGSMVSVGGHNLLEPALLRKVVFYGPYMHNFRESKELLTRVGAGFMVHNATELSQRFLLLAKDTKLRAELGEKAQTAVLANRGATRRTIEILKGLVNQA